MNQTNVLVVFAYILGGFLQDMNFMQNFKAVNKSPNNYITIITVENIKM